LTADGAEGRGVAIARFIRSQADPKLAEVAITVIDEMQEQGIGHLLLERLIEAARERGVNRFRFQILGNNEKAKALVRDVCPSMKFSGDSSVISAETSLEETLGEGLEGLFDVLRLVASRAVLTPLEAGLQGADMALEAVARGGETVAQKVSQGLDSNED
jgi:predicted GNAT family acetyltransferase